MAQMFAGTIFAAWWTLVYIWKRHLDNLRFWCSCWN